MGIIGIKSAIVVSEGCSHDFYSPQKQYRLPNAKKNTFKRSKPLIKKIYGHQRKFGGTSGIFSAFLAKMKQKQPMMLPSV